MQNYAKLISENDAFIHSVVAVPIGDFQHATLDILFSMDKNTDIEKTMLQDMISEQLWCLNVEKSTVPNKVMIMTTQDNLEMAQRWIDHTRVTLYKDNLKDKLDVTLKKKLFPRQLDKPNLTAASMAYTAMLCHWATYAKVTTGPTKAPNTTQPQKAQVNILFAESDFPPLPTNNATTTQTNMDASTSTTTVTATTTAIVIPLYDYKAELECLSKEIKTSLWPQFECLFTQLEQKIDSLVQSREEQEKVNINMSKQLNFLVENVAKLLKHPIYQMHSSPNHHAAVKGTNDESTMPPASPQ